MATDYLLDTNAVTSLAAKDATALSHVRSLGAADEIYSCFIVVGEWEYGIRHADGSQRQSQIRTAGAPIFAALTAIWESTPAIALEYGHLHAALRAAGQLIPTNDIWIAATARIYAATVVTTDPHFGRIAGLSVVDWTKP